MEGDQRKVLQLRLLESEAQSGLGGGLRVEDHDQGAFVDVGSGDP